MGSSVGTKQYLDDQGNPILSQDKVYLDDEGKPKQAVKPTPKPPEQGGSVTANPIIKASEKIFPWMIQQAPMALGTAGGLAGAGAGSVFGLGVGAVPGAIGGAALGGAGGEALKQLFNRATGAKAPASSGEAAKNIGKEGAIQGAFEGGGQLLAPAVRTLSKFLPKGLQNVILENGMKFPTTPGTRNPGGQLAKLEAVTGGLPGGGPFRAARQTEQNMAQFEIQQIARNAAQHPLQQTGDIGQAFNSASRAVRNTAGPLHEMVAKAMSSPKAAEPVIKPIQDIAKKELAKPSLQMLLSKTDVNPTILKNLEIMSNSSLGLVKGGLKPGGIWQISKDTISELKGLARKPSISRNEARIVHNLTDALESEMNKAAEKTGGPKLAAVWKKANALTSQSYALEEVRDALRGTLLKPTNVPGTKQLSPIIKGQKLEDALNKLAISDNPKSLSTLERALGPKDSTTIKQIATRINQAQKISGQNNIAVKFKTIALITGMAGLVTGHIESAANVMAGSEVAAWVFAKAMTSQVGRSATLNFLKAPAGSAAALRFGGEMVQLAFGVDDNGQR